MNHMSVPTRARYRTVMFAILLAIIMYIDRVCISQAALSMRGDLGLSQVQMGWAFSVFGWAYALFEIPGGWLGDRIGHRWMLIIGAAAANFRAGGADLMMQFRAANHGIRGGLTNLRAIGEYENMRRVGVFAAHEQTILHRLQADSMALVTVFDALFHIVIDMRLRFSHYVLRADAPASASAIFVFGLGMKGATLVPPTMASFAITARATAD
jgi:MFS family permease